jgi:hypothetical protein
MLARSEQGLKMALQFAYRHEPTTPTVSRFLFCLRCGDSFLISRLWCFKAALDLEAS